MMNIKIDQNSDCFGEIIALRHLLKQNKRFTYKDFTNLEVVEIAINELYDCLVAEKKAGINQRNI